VPAIPGSFLRRLDEYHGYLSVPDATPRPPVGTVMTLVPNHVCPVVNLFDELLVVERGTIVGRWPVDARGHLS